MDKIQLIAIVFLIIACASTQSKQPHILLVVIDDLGWSDVGYQNISLIKTPNIDKLASEGVILDNYYVQPICTPTRSALMTGKYPIHTGMQHLVILPAQPYGLPLDLPLLPQNLKKVGYSTHMVGKWHLGFYEWEYTPTYRGFDTFYGYYNGAEDYFTHKVMGYLDLRDQKSPVTDANNVYSSELFAKRAEQIISNHNASVPLFLYLPFQSVHSPDQAPESFIKKYDFIDDKTRRIYAAKVSAVDEAIGQVTDALIKKGIWDDTLMVFTTDNGGMPISGGYNWPLRGMKTTLWEGGVRGVGFVRGSMIEKKARKCKELLHVTDWFPTLSAIAGFDDLDQDIDGFNIWDTISKGAPSPRTEILHNIDVNDTGIPIGQGIALRSGHMKLIMQVLNIQWFKPPELGQNELDSNVESPKRFFIKEALFNITADPEERNDLSAKLPDVVSKMKARVDFYKSGVVPKRNLPNDPEATATAKRNGAWTPWRGSIHDMVIS